MRVVCSIQVLPLAATIIKHVFIDEFAARSDTVQVHWLVRESWLYAGFKSCLDRYQTLSIDEFTAVPLWVHGFAHKAIITPF
jgi:hypothetical protein